MTIKHTLIILSLKNSMPRMSMTESTEAGSFRISTPSFAGKHFTGDGSFARSQRLSNPPALVFADSMFYFRSFQD